MKDWTRQIDDLDDNAREHFEERAAIREYCGGESRDMAEIEALSEVLGVERRSRG